MITQIPIHQEETKSLLGKEVKIFGDKFSPEAVRQIHAVRSYGSLQAIEVRVHPNQPGPRVRVSFLGQWELTGGEA